MKLTKEFDRQWSTLTNCLTAEIIQSANEGTVISYEQLERIFNNEKKRWTVRGQYQYEWLELLRKKDPDVAAEFVNALESLHLTPISPSKKTSAVIAVGPAVGGAVIGFGIAKCMSFSTLMTAVGSVAIGALGFSLGKNLQSGKLADALEKDAESYKTQLQAAGKGLADILKRVEQ